MTDEKEGRQLAAPTAGRWSRKPLKEVSTLEDLFRSGEFLERIQECVPEHVTPTRMLHTFAGAVRKAPLLAKADIRSFIGACLVLSQVGLEPGTPLQNAHLIPFRKGRGEKARVEIQMVFGYPGLLALAYRSPLVRSITANVVMPGDDFSWNFGTDAHLRHRPLGRHRAGDMPEYAYMFAELAEGGQAFEVMPWATILDIRDSSQAYRRALELRDEAKQKGWNEPLGYTEAPWVKFPIQMARKTPIRSGTKYLPREVRLTNAITIDEATDRRGSLDFRAAFEAETIDGKFDYLSAQADEAESDYDRQYDEGERQDGTGQSIGERKTQVQGADLKAGRDRKTQDRKAAAGPTGTARTDDPDAREPADVRKPDAEPRAEQPTGSVPSWVDEPESDQPVDEDADGSEESWEAPLLDIYGESVPDGPNDTFRDRMVWCSAFDRLWQETKSRDEAQALLDHNADTLAGLKADPETAGIAVWHVPAPRKPPAVSEPKAEPPKATETHRNDPPPKAEREPGDRETIKGFATIEVPTDRGRQSWAGYATGFKAVLDRIAPFDLPEWLEVQRTNIEAAPKTYGLQIARTVVDVYRGAGEPLPDWIKAIVAPGPAKETAKPDVEAKPDGDADQKWVDDIIRDIEASTRDDIPMLRRHAAIQRKLAQLNETRPELAEMVEAAFRRKEGGGA